MKITFFDVLILLAMFGGALWGFYRGFFRQALSTLVIYVSIVLSTLGYRSVSRMISKQPTSGTDMLSFVLLMVIVSSLLLLMTKDLVGDIDINRMKVWVNVGGMIFGFINTTIWCAVLLIIIRSATGGAPWIGYQGLQDFFQNQTSNSWMARAFGPVMRFLVALIRPWLFGHDLPPLLLGVM